MKESIRPEKKRNLRLLWSLLIVSSFIGIIAGIQSISAGSLLQLNFGNGTYIYFNETESQLNGTVLVNGSQICTQASGCPGGSSDENNYSTALSVNQTGTAYSVVMGRNGASTLIANFTVSASSSGNVTSTNGTSGWWARFTNSTNIVADGVSCAGGYAINVLSNDSVCQQFETPASAAATYYLLTNPSGYISDGNTGWDNVYGFLNGTNLSEGTGFTDIVPGANNTYNLGNGTRVWKDIYTSNGTIYLIENTTNNTLKAFNGTAYWNGLALITTGSLSIPTVNLTKINASNDTGSHQFNFTFTNGTILSVTINDQGLTSVPNINYTFNATCTGGQFPQSFGFNLDGTINSTQCGTPTDTRFNNANPNTAQMNFSNGTIYNFTVGSNSIVLDWANITSGSDTNVCTGTDKVTSVNITNGNLIINCAADQTGAGGSTMLSMNVTNLSSNTFNVSIVWSNGTTYSALGEKGNVTGNYSANNFIVAGNDTHADSTSQLQYQLDTKVRVSNLNITNMSYQNNFSNPYAFQTQEFGCYESEFFGATLGGIAPFANTVLGNGGLGGGTPAGDDNHTGLITIRDGTNAYSGAFVGLANAAAGSITPQAGDEMRGILYIPSGKIADVSGRTGFFDTQTGADATDGCYVLWNGTLNRAELRCRNAGTLTVNATNITFSNNTWYGWRVRHLTKTTVNATIWNDSATIVLDVGLSTGINTNPSAFGTSFFQSTTDAASDIAYIDYMGFCRKWKPQRAWSWGE